MQRCGKAGVGSLSIALVFVLRGGTGRPCIWPGPYFARACARSVGRRAFSTAAPPHDETGHTWHHPDSYLFTMTKYGIEKMIGKPYPNNMPAYEDKLTDEEILAVLSYIKSTWSGRTQRQHDQINARAKAQ